MGENIHFKEIREIVINKIDITREVSDNEIRDIIDDVILDFCNNKYMRIQDKYNIQKEVYDSIRGLDVLEDLLNDNSITEIMVNGPDKIFVEKSGEIKKIEKNFKSRERLNDIIQQIVSSVNRRVNESSPISDSRLKDGSRVNVVLNPIALDGPVITIRKFPKERITMDKYLLGIIFCIDIYSSNCFDSYFNMVYSWSLKIFEWVI